MGLDVGLDVGIMGLDIEIVTLDRGIVRLDVELNGIVRLDEVSVRPDLKIV